MQISNKTQIILFSILLSVSLIACKSKEAVTLIEYHITLKPDIIIQCGKINGGENGTSVVFDSINNLYYTFFAGSKNFYVERFDVSGNKIDSSKIGFDARGVWYNKETKKIEGNSYDGGGIFEIDIEKNRLLGLATSIFEENEQPDKNSAGAYDYDDNNILYFDEGVIKKYSRERNKYVGDIKISGLPSDEYINFTTPIYLGYKKNEIGLLDYGNRAIYTIDKNTGKYSKKLLLPPDSKTYPKLRFSYANNRIWIFDVDNKKWLGFPLRNSYFAIPKAKRKRFLGVF